MKTRSEHYFTNPKVFTSASGTTSGTCKVLKIQVFNLEKIKNFELVEF